MNVKAATIPKKSSKELEKEISRIFQLQKAYTHVLRKSSASERIVKLNRLRKKITIESDNICKALALDYAKPELESDLLEIMPTIAEISDAVTNLPKWMKAQSVSTPLHLLGATSEIRFEPKGQSLIIAPWNYPFQLTIGPLVAAIAAGNTAIIKPSEFTPNVAGLLEKIIQETFDEEEVAVIQGAAEASQALLEQPFDHIFFTGSPQVGKIVMAAAAKHLSAVTLELGGKSPVLVDGDVNLSDAARKITWGKFINAGQTCVAPDYVLVPQEKVSAFISHMRDHLKDFYGDTKNWSKQPDYCHIVNERHTKRLKGLLDSATKDGAKVEIGGSIDEINNVISPTVLSNVSLESKIMQEEIFGPILPIIGYQDKQEALDLINAKDKPLALYIFSDNNKTIEKVITATSAGGTCINDVVIQLGNPNLPFGGINNSGLGNYHGFYGFRAFSHERAVMKQNKLFSTMQAFYPPYDNSIREFVQKTFKHIL